VVSLVLLAGFASVVGILIDPSGMVLALGEDLYRDDLETKGDFYIYDVLEKFTDTDTTNEP